MGVWFLYGSLNICSFVLINMKTSFSSFISRRLSLRAGNRRWAPAIVVAVGGIALSFMVMLVSVAVVTGFKDEIRRKIMGFDAQITVSPLGKYYYGENESLSLTPALKDAISQSVSSAGVNDDPEVSVTMRLPGLLKTDNDFMGVVFKAFGCGYGWGFEHSNLLEGELPREDNPRGIAISASMARKLSIGLGDKVNVYFFVGEGIRPRKFEVSGIYCSNFGEYDDVIAYASRDALAGLLKYGSDEGDTIEIRGLGNDGIEAVAGNLQQRLNEGVMKGAIPQSLVVSTVYSSGAVYFNWLDMLDTNIVVILILMGCVSGFMLVSCVLILILERIRMVGLLKSMGATDRQVGMIFVRLGTRITMIGLLLGNLIALSFIGAEWLWRFIPLDASSYYLSYVPVRLSLCDWAMLNVGYACLSFLLMTLPAALVCRLSPVKVLRFE